MFGGEVRRGFPEEVGYIAVGRQLAQSRVIDVGAQCQAVVEAGQAGPDACRLVGLAAGQDVGQVISVPGQSQDAAEPFAFNGAAGRP